MYLVTKVTADPWQSQTLLLQDGSSFFLSLYFRPMQYGWFIDELTYDTFTVRGLRVVNSPNMLHQFYQKLPFGLACFSKVKREPMLQEDFSSGTCSIYVLERDEVDQYAEYLKNG